MTLNPNEAKKFVQDIDELDINFEKDATKEILTPIEGTREPSKKSLKLNDEQKEEFEKFDDRPLASTMKFNEQQDIKKQSSQEEKKEGEGPEEEEKKDLEERKSQKGKNS